ncbi:energy transducer TonB family protein [Alteraurantiacibacter aquimixticola]|uniref:TonB family protein n=1 Tax=Alteraurantiacibacter aquimixticola TaxID=2489173 RepID=A0A4T3F7K3_9SPHN|nr:energy transducer TonB [Alteraurantiacibacter aquimixticola]TIX51692.1 TonB family protein [Alteraurantiacibacter aquimixticola]
MYADPYTGWTRQQAVSAAVSILLNLAIFVGFAWFTGIGSAVVQRGAALAVFNVGHQGEVEAESPVEEASPPPASQSAQAEARKAVEPQELALLTEPELVSEDAAEADEEVAPEVLHPAEPLHIPTRNRLAQPVERVRIEPARQQASVPAVASRGGDAQPSSSTEGDSYGASVKQHLLRFRRQNTVGPGSAFIHFTVLLDGKVNGVGVARTSGSSRFDREAMQMVRRAVPFPPPPDGVRRRFNFEITGR